MQRWQEWSKTLVLQPQVAPTIFTVINVAEAVPQPVRQRRGDRSERATTRHRVADQHLHPLRDRAPDTSPNSREFPDSRLAEHHDGSTGAPGGTIDGGAQRGQFVPPPDQRIAARPLEHPGAPVAEPDRRTSHVG